MRAKTIVSLFNTRSKPLCHNYLHIFKCLFTFFFIRGTRTNRHHALGPVQKSRKSTKASFIACCWDDSFKDWEERNNKGGVFKTHRMTAAVFKGNPENSCVKSISDYAFFFSPIFWHQYGNNTYLLTRAHFVNTSRIHSDNTPDLGQRMNTRLLLWIFQIQLRIISWKLVKNV